MTTVYRLSYYCTESFDSCVYLVSSLEKIELCYVYLVSVYMGATATVFVRSEDKL